MCTLLLSIAMAACGGGGGGEGAAPVSSTLNFFPTDADARWVYESGGSTFISHIPGTETLGGRTLTVLQDSEPSGAVLDRSLFAVQGDGIYTYPPSGSDAFSAALGPLRIIALPVVTGSSFVQFDRTIDFGQDADGDGRSDPAAVRIVVDAVSVGPCTSGALRFDTCLHQRTSFALRYTLSRDGRLEEVSGVFDERYAAGVGLVSRTSNTGEPALVTRAYRVGARVSDAAPPVPRNATPAAGAVVGGVASVSISFDEQVDPTSIDAQTLAVFDATEQPVAGAAQLDLDGVLRFTPAQAWLTGSYRARLLPQVRDLLGNRLTAETDWRFTIDRAGPGVVRLTPEAGSGKLGLSEPIVVHFSEPIDPATVDLGSVSLVNRNRTDLPTRYSVAIEGATMTLTPTVPLLPATGYQLTLGTKLADALGNPLLAPYEAALFTTQGLFAYPDRYVTDRMPEAIAAGDINSDGRVDLVYMVGSADDIAQFGHLMIQLAQADGGWAAPVTLDARACFSFSSVVAVADFDGDGRMDIARSGQDCGVRIWRQGADGALGPMQILSTRATDAIRAVDIDRDGRVDLVGVSVDGSGYRVWRQDDTGQLILRTDQALTLPSLRDLAVGDVNGDGRPDIVALSISDTDSRRMMVAVQQADGGFAAPAYRTEGSYLGVAIGDINGDGRNDVVQPQGYFLQQGDGSLGAHVPFDPSLIGVSVGVELADLDGDGRLDVVVSKNVGVGQVVVFIQQPGGALSAGVSYLGGNRMSNPHSLLATDVNGDGRVDLVDGDAVLLHSATAVSTNALHTPDATARSVSNAIRMRARRVTATGAR